jgi:hypothetical protein
MMEIIKEFQPKTASSFIVYVAYFSPNWYSQMPISDFCMSTPIISTLIWGNPQMG